MKRTLNRDIRQSLKHSKARFLSIVCLMMLGSFALVGLKVVKPNVEQMLHHYFNTYQAADLFVTGELGISQTDLEELQTLPNTIVEPAYFVDTTVVGHHDAIRLYSMSETLSQFQIVSGRLPQQAHEIALQETQRQHYQIGDTLTFNDNHQPALHVQQFTVVGFVHSPDILSNTALGQARSGNGSLTYYGVILPSVFDTSTYSFVKLSFADLKSLSPLSEQYAQQLAQHQQYVRTLLQNNGTTRLKEVKDRITSDIASGESQITSAQVELSSAESALTSARAQLDVQQAEWESASIEVASQDETIQQLTDEYNAIDEAYRQSPQIIAQKEALDSARSQVASAKSDIQQGAEQLESATNALSEQEQTFSEQQDEAQQNIQQAEQNIADATSMRQQLKEPTYRIDTRQSWLTGAGYRMLSGSVDGIHAVGNLFPVILFAVASLVTMTTMSRFVSEERTQSGLLKALGYTDFDVLRKFILYGVAASFIGSVSGTLAGMYGLPMMLIHTLYADLALPPVTLQFNWLMASIAIICSLACALIPTYWVAHQELKETPAHLLLPKPPVQGSSIWLERIPYLWQRLSFTQKVTFRNLFRYKKRMFMTIFGVAGSVALLFAGLGITASLDGIVDKQYGDIVHYDLMVTLADTALVKDKQHIERAMQQATITQSTFIYTTPKEITIPNTDHAQDVLFIVAEPQNVKSFITLQQRSTQQPIHLRDNGAVMTEQLADLLHANIHTNIPLEHPIQLADIAEFYAGHLVWMSPHYYTEITGEQPTPNTYLITVSDQEKIQSLAEQFIQMDGVNAVVQNTHLIAQINAVVASLSTSMNILTLVSVILAVVILYNLTNINIAERIRELSTIKVLGFYDREVSLYIYRETAILSTIGIIVGLFSGQLLHRILLNVIRPDNVMFNPQIAPHVFLIPIVTIVIIVALLGLYVHYTLTRINMLDALKSVD